MKPTIVASRFTSPIKRHGGKHYLAPKLVRMMPPHEVYVEPYAGGLSTLFRKPQSAVEVVGDIDPNLMAFWDCLSGDAGGDFRRFLRGLDYSEGTFRWALDYLDRQAECPFHPQDRMRAAAFLCVNRMSRSGLGKDYSWSDRLRRKMPEQLSSWGSMLANLDAAHRRLRGAIVHWSDAPEEIHRNDSPDTLFYLDPPYPHDTRTAQDAYDYEMTPTEHKHLLWSLVDAKGKALVSTYPNALYDQILGGAGWYHVEYQVANHSGQGKVKQPRTEQVWANYPIGDGR